ncbi:MAG: cupredoxin domain-containing protein [Actinomycetota bacterium]
MHSRFRIALALLLVALAFGALAACGGGDSQEAQDDPANEAVGEEDPEGTEGEADSSDDGSSGEENTIVASGLAWSPDTLSVDTGAEVAVENQDSTEHTFTIKGTDVNQDLGAGASVDVTIDLEAGDYDWVCEIHPSMTGELTVN